VSLILLLIPAFLAALFDLTVASAFRLFGAQPSITVALLAAWAVLRRREEAMLMAPAAGLVLGLLGNEPLGASMLGLAPVVLLASMRNPEVTEGRIYIAVAVALGGAAAYVLIVAVITSIAGKFAPEPQALLRQMAGTALLTAPMTAMVYFPLARIAWQPHLRGDFRRY
jgi:rod shape-determining protein MreD